MISGLITQAIPKPHRNKPKGDPQRSRVYMMERELVGLSLHHSAPKKELQIFLDHACRYYKIPSPKFRVYNKPDDHTFGYSESESPKEVNGPRRNPIIYLNRGFHGANLITLMHELAHYIADFTWVGHSGHGPKFVGIYMHLLHKYRVMPSDAFRLIAKRRRITIARRFKPSAIRG